MKPTAAALEVTCERCGAQAGEGCTGLEHPTDFHGVRVVRGQAAARAAFTGPSTPEKEAVREIIQEIRNRHGW